MHARSRVVAVTLGALICIGAHAQEPEVDLFTAVLTDNIDAVKQHIAGGTELEIKEPGGGSTALNLACVLGKTEMVALLVEAGADLESRNNDGGTPLFNASFFCHPKIVDLLLDKGSKVDVVNNDGTAIVELMEIPWEAGMESLYRPLFGVLRIQRSLGEIKQARPLIAKRLRDHVAKNRNNRPAPANGATNSRSDKTAANRVDKRDTPPISAADWAMYNHDVLGWRFNQAETKLTAENASQLVLKWKFPAEDSGLQVGAIHATPVVVNGHVYFGTATYPAFYKLRPDGTVAWVHHTRSGRTSDSPLPAGGRNLIDAANGVLTSALVTGTAVYFGDSAGVFHALDRFTGDQLWRVNSRAEGFPGHHPINVFHASAILVDDKVIVGGGGYEHPYPLNPEYPCCTGRGFVVAFDPDDGHVIWKYEVGQQPQEFQEPVVITDAKGEHRFRFGPSTSSVWSTPSFDQDSGTIFFGTDVNNSPRAPTAENQRYDTRYSAAVVALDVKTGSEKWVTQVNPGDVYNHSMAGYDAENRVHRDGSVGDTPKIYSIDVDGKTTKVLGVGCKNGGFYLLRADNGEIVAETPIYRGKPEYPLQPPADTRMIALPSLIGGIQTGCATDGTSVFTNGIDWISINSLKPGRPEAGRVVSLSLDLSRERWRHERPKVVSPVTSGDPVAAGIALAGGIACFAPTVSEKLVILDASSGKTLKQIPIGVAWSGPSISRGRIYVGTGSILFLKKQVTGTLYSFGLPGEDEIDRMASGSE